MRNDTRIVIVWSTNDESVEGFATYIEVKYMTIKTKHYGD